MATPVTPEILQPEVNGEAISIQQDALQVSEKAKQITAILTAEDYVLACTYGKDITAREKRIKEFFKPLKDAAHAAHKKLCDTENSFLTPLSDAKSHLSKITADYNEQKRLKDLEAQRKSEEEARKRAEDEALEQAQYLESIGQKEAAEQVLSAPITVAPVVAPASTISVKGAASRTNYEAEIFDFLVLVKAVAEGRVPIMALEANQTFLNQQARALKSMMSYPGVRVKETKGTTFRS